jgi:RNA polymerase sigma factor (sigma-70 family)
MSQEEGMATARLSDFFRRLARGMTARTLEDYSDRQLVERALERHDQAALEAIVHRHSAMVCRVSWRVLQHAQDTEDVFQATFLVLAQKLRTLRKYTSLASWLHGVAHRVALKVKAQSAARRRREHKTLLPDTVPPDDVTWGELRSALDAELSRLPDKWRLPLILCYLEGRTQDESASQLGWSKSTLRRRLEEARAALGGRLSRRGIVWPAALSAVLMSDCMASAAPAPGLIAKVVEAAAGVVAGKMAATATASARVAALTEGVLKAMFLTKLKALAAVVVLAVGFMLGGAVLWYHETVAAHQGEPIDGGAFEANAAAQEQVQASHKHRDLIQRADILVLSVGGVGQPEIKRQLESERLVTPDGAVSLESYGAVFVADLTTEQAGAVIERHLATHLPSVKVTVAIKGRAASVQAKKEKAIQRLPDETKPAKDLQARHDSLLKQIDTLGQLQNYVSQRENRETLKKTIENLRRQVDELTTELAADPSSGANQTVPEDVQIRRALDELEAARAKVRQAKKTLDAARDQLLAAHERYETAKRRGQPKDPRTEAGLLCQIDNDARSVYVEMWIERKFPDGALWGGPTGLAARVYETFAVAKDAMILEDNIKTTLADLKVGSHVVLRFDPDGKNVIRITTSGGTVPGQYVSANAARNTITAITRDKRRIFHLVKETEVIGEGGKVARVQDLKEGAMLLLTLSVEDANTVIRIEALPPEKEKKE